MDFVTPTNYRDCAALSLALTTVIFSSFAVIPAGIGYLGYRWVVTRSVTPDRELQIPFQETQSNAVIPFRTIEEEETASSSDQNTISSNKSEAFDEAVYAEQASLAETDAGRHEKCEVLPMPSETNSSGCFGIRVIPKQLIRNARVSKISLYLLDVKYHASDREYYSIEDALLHRYGLTKVIKFLEIGSNAERCLAHVSMKVGIPFRSLNLAEILSHGYTFTNDPQEGDLVLYSHRGRMIDSIQHIGLVSKIVDKSVWVESKWGAGSVYRHLEEAVPIDYGDEVCYLRK